jgi:hypothetical protein
MTGLLQRVTWWFIAPVSRLSMDDSLFIFEDETFAARAAIPPPQRSDLLFGLPVHEVELV